MNSHALRTSHLGSTHRSSAILSIQQIDATSPTNSLVVFHFSMKFSIMIIKIVGSDLSSSGEESSSKSCC